MLEGQYPNGNHSDYEDAIATGFEKLVAAGRALENPRAFVTTVAINAMKRILRRAALQQLAGPDADDADEPNDILDRQTSEWSDPTAEQAAADDAYEFMRELIDGWESRNVKTATSLVLAAAKIGEALSSEELAQRLEELLDQEVPPATARQWRKRGLDRLRRQLVDADLLEETEN
jgi:DNA-directed RNA polymerase specialized sigma24 family protein